jgi:hypothetical protein
MNPNEAGCGAILCQQWAFVNTGKQFLEELSDWFHMKKDFEEFCLVGYNVYSPLKVSRRFGGIRLHLQGQEIS